MAEVFTVSQVNNYIKNLFTRDFLLNRICVAGEVSNCKYHSSGHIYFTLKDRGGAINCIMFASGRQRLLFKITDGQQIEATGQVAVYEKNGTYGLYVRECRLAGNGELYERFLKLKQELEDMGLFDSIYKKPVPRYCQKIGIVTALTGAAVRDIINVSKRRNPYCELVLYPALVQGAGAAESVVRGIRTLDAMGLDVIIVGRGGGSIEDLWAFNEEIVAKAVFDAETPIISAVGHETDFTITDFVADLRAPTPSAAAELATFEYDVLMQEIAYRREALGRAAEHKLRMREAALTALEERLKRMSPEAVLDRYRQRLEAVRREMSHILSVRLEKTVSRRRELEASLRNAVGQALNDSRHRLSLLASILDGVSPLKRMSRGFGFVENEEGRAVVSVEDVSRNSELTVYVADGSILATVRDTERKNYEKN